MITSKHRVSEVDCIELQDMQETTVPGMNNKTSQVAGVDKYKPNYNCKRRRTCKQRQNVEEKDRLHLPLWVLCGLRAAQAPSPPRRSWSPF